MKKLLSTLLCAMMLFGLSACSQGTNNETNYTTVKDAVEILENVWNQYEENDKFYAMGGDLSSAKENAPGKFNLELKEELQHSLMIPMDNITWVDDVASLRHSMNVNTFTAAVFHVVDTKNLSQLTDNIKNYTLNNQWYCGFPDLLLMATINDDYLISAYGKTEQINVFKTKLTEVYPNVKFVVEENID